MNWVKLRARRNQLLEETDKTQLADFPIDTKLRGLYKEYRQYLRNCPSMFDETTIITAKVKNFDEWLTWKKSQIY